MKISTLYFILIFSLNYSTDLFPQETLPLTEIEKKESLCTHLIFESDFVDSLIIYRGFIVKYDILKKSPKYTIHCLTPYQISPEGGIKVKRRSSFFVDDINLRHKSATNADYKRSGYDRGHMVPAGDFYWNKLGKDETFVLTNISPQNPTLNRGIWNYLEMNVRDRVIIWNIRAYIITGTIFTDIFDETIGYNKVGIPNYLYKIIYFPQANVMYAFLFDNYVNAYLSNLNDYQVRVDDLEKITGEDFFDCIGDSLENKLESYICTFISCEE